MSKIREIFANTSWLMISQVITSIFAFFWTILVARYLGVADFGILTFAISFTTILSIFMDLGINTYVTRDLSRDPELSYKYIGNTIPLKILLSIMSFFLAFIVLIIMGYDVLTIETTLIFAIHTIFLYMGYLFNGVFQSFGKMKYQAIGIIINSFFLLFGTVVVVILNLGLLLVAIVYSFASLVTLIYLYLKIRSKIVIPKFQFDFSFWKKAIKKAIPFGLTAIFTTIYFMIDTVMLSLMDGNIAVGIYSAAYKIIYVFSTLYTVYNYVVFPLMSKLYTNSEDLLRISYEKSIKYLLLMILPIAVGITFYSQDIVLLIYGNEYILSKSVLEILIWNVVFMFVNGASTVLLNSSNKEVAVTKINAIACLFNVVLNLILISYFSYIGASIATVLTGLMICILMNYIIIKDKYKPDISLLKDILKIILSSVILAIILYLLHLPLILAIPIAIIIYLIAIFLTKTLDDVDKSVIKKIIGLVKR